MEAAAAPTRAAEAEELAPAAECRARAGLPNSFAKLRAGGEVRIAYLGGSITAQDGWRPKTLNWFQEQFRPAKLSQINAAIGGTGSDLGVFRLKHDVLDQNPDLFFVEFAVNDAGAPVQQILRCMEGIVRQTWRRDPRTDICFVYTLAGNMLQTLQAGHFPCSATAMEKVADHYGIPSIHLGLEVARLEKAGKLIFKGDKPKTDAERAAVADKILFSPDAVWPAGADSGEAKRLQAGEFNSWFDLGAHARGRLHGRLHRAGGVAEFPNVTARFVCTDTNPARWVATKPAGFKLKGRKRPKEMASLRA